MESKVEMRKIFCDTLIDLAKADERICIVNSDSRQISGTRDFEQAYPDRAFNVGIAPGWLSVENVHLSMRLVPL